MLHNQGLRAKHLTSCHALDFAPVQQSLNKDEASQGIDAKESTVTVRIKSPNVPPPQTMFQHPANEETPSLCETLYSVLNIQDCRLHQAAESDLLSLCFVRLRTPRHPALSVFQVW